MLWPRLVFERRALLPQLLDRQVLEDALLDLVQIVVVLVQDLPRPADVDGPAAQLGPGQTRQPLEVGDDHAVLGRGRRQALQPRELPIRLAPGLLRQAGLLDLPTQLGQPSVAIVLIAELLVNRPELLPQVEVALLLGKPLLGVGGDLPAQLAHGQLALEQIYQPAELGRDRLQLE